MISKAIFLLNAAKRNGILISVKDGALQLKRTNANAIDPQLLQEIKDNKESIIDFLNNDKLKSTRVDQSANPLKRYDRNLIKKVRLSFSQERLWFIDQLEGTVQYHLPTVLRLNGKLNKEALVYALKNIVDRHESLRSVIVEEQDTAYQRVMDINGWALAIVDGSAYKNDPEALHHYIKALTIQPFNLSTDYMLRASLVTLEQEEHLLVVTMHHIASDGSSTTVIVKEVIELYSSFVEGRKSNLEPLAIQYADYAIWQRNYLQGDVLENKIAYWKDKLNGVAALQLPTDFIRPVIQSTHGTSTGFNIDKSLTKGIQQLCQQAGTTLFMALLAVFKVLLHRHSGQQDICVGSPIAGRQQEEVEGLIGFFVNTLSLRTQVDGEDSFISLLAKVKTTTMDGYQHQEAPFEKVVEAVVKQRDLGRSPIFQVMFVLQNTPDAPELVLPGLTLTGELLEKNTSKFDLSFYITEMASGLQCAVEYCTDLFRPDTISRMIGHYKTLLAEIVKSPQQKIGRLPMLGNQEQQQVIASLTGKNVAYPLNKSLVDLFEEQVLKTPASTALIFEGVQINYQQLNERSNQLAHYLINKGIKAGTPVPVCVEHSIEMVIGILGILKAGCTYVPIDADYPIERINYILDDINAKIFITNNNLANVFITAQTIQSGERTAANAESRLNEKGFEIVETGLPLISILFNEGEISGIEFNKKSLEALESGSPHPELVEGRRGAGGEVTHPAWIVYTSGSSGKPKGVKLTNAGIINRFYWMWETFPFAPGEINAIKTSIGFVDHVWEIFGALNRGVPSVIFPKATLLDLDLLTTKLTAEKITRLVLVPSLLRTLLNKLQDDKISLPQLKYWTCSGEILPVELATDFYKVFPSTTYKLLNIYGSSEVSADVSCYDTSMHDHTNVNIHQRIPIGKPLPNTNLYLLDNYLQPVARGITGEICVSGIQVAEGYLNLPELTAQRFINDPFSDQPGATMFKTGDYGRLANDGNIEYLGRIDDQVKIRGNRVELGEVEAVLQMSGMVKQCVVLSRKENNGDSNLIGYVVAEETIDKTALSTNLKKKLPDYMVPSIWIQLPVFPLLSNGKIDKKSLPAHGALETPHIEYVAPVTETELQLAAIWQRLLGKQQVGIHDNFFELGGHSLLAMRVVSSIRKLLEVELSIKDLFLHSTIASLSAHLQKQHKGLLLPALAIQVRPLRIPLSFSQERLWFIDRLEGSIPYNLPVVLKLTGKVNMNALSNAIQTIVQRHEVLRTVLLEEDGHAYQFIQDYANWKLTTTDVSGFNDESLQAFIRKIINVPFDLSCDYMLRACLAVINDSEHILVVTMHHIASDGWSMSVIVKEVVELYGSHQEGRLSPLSPLPVQYADYAIWQRKYLQGAALDNKLAYWKKKLEGVAPLQLPADYVRPAIKRNTGERLVFSIDKELTDRLQQVSRQQDATLFMSLLAAFNVLLHRYTGQEDICVGTPIANRTTQEVEELIGFFVNTLALRTELSEQSSFITLLQQVRATTLDAYAHQDTPFEKVVDVVVKERDLARSPIFQVMFVLQNTPQIPALHLGEIVLTREKTDDAVSKFDITLTITESPLGLHAAFDYCTGLFKESTILTMINHFKKLLSSIIENPYEKIGVLPMLHKAEEHQLLVTFSDSVVAYPADKTTIHLLEEQAVKNPDNIAVVFAGEKLTYADLNQRSNKIANYLRSKGVKKETLVPLCFNRSAAMIVAMVGILKSGGAYVPIDPDYPEERTAYLLQDTAATIVLSNEESSAKLNAHKNISIIKIDTDWPEINKLSANNLPIEITHKNLAYVIYTSGSTGKPKGVMIEHGALVDHCFGVIKSAALQGCSSFALFAPLVFDAGHSIIHSSFILGSALHVLSKQLLNDGDQLTAYINAHSIDCIKMVPSLWLSYADANNFVLAKKVMIFGGDTFSINVLDRLVKLKYEGAVYNHYGPTEATIGKTIHHLDLNKQYATIPIGKPFSNTSLYITNKLLQPVPIGVPGELYIAGEGLARAYLNNPLLTAEKFIQNPFSDNPYSKMYKTGDQVRWLPDGNIEYLGRIDEQVKIRGFRIEPGEIENVLQESGLVRQAIVLPKKSGGGNPILVGYVVPIKNFDKDDIVSYLKNKLPEYMIPALWVPLQEIPLTSNGKIDRKALPDPDAHLISNNQYTAPRSELEQTLTNIWRQLLGVQRCGIHDNFFELGGDSIITIQVVSRARQAGYQFQVADIFTHQTIAKLALVIEQRINSPVHPIAEQGVLSGPVGLLPIQQRYFAKEHAAINHFNQTVLLQIDKRIDEPALIQAIQELVRHHDILRGRFFKKDVQWRQEYFDKETVLIIDDISAADDNDAASLITAHSAEYQQSLDIEKGDLIRVVLIKTSPTTTHNRLLIVIHHLAVDGVSWRVLLEGLELLLSAILNAQPASLGHKTSSYRQWYHALEQYAKSDKLLSQSAYWQKIIKSYHPIPVDKECNRSTKANERGFHNVRLDKDQTRQLLQDAPRLYHTEINDLLLCALYITISGYTGENEIIIGLEGHGRQDIAPGIDTSKTMGWFTSHYPLLLSGGDGNHSLDNYIKSVKELLRQVPDKGLGYGVLKYINQQPSLQGVEPWDIVFNYLGQLDNVLTQGQWLKPAVESAGASVNEAYLYDEKISVSGSIQGGELQLNWGYSKLYFNDNTINELAEKYIVNLKKIIAHCTDGNSTEVIFTPSDYGLGAIIKYEELDRFLAEPIKNKTRSESIDGLYRLSGLQQGLLFHSLYESGFGTYVHQFGCDLVGTNLQLFTQSWNRVIENHSILRSAFYYDIFSVPVQAVYKEVELPVTLLDFRDMRDAAQAAAVTEYENADRHQPFDYKTAPLMRLALIQLSENRYRMVWTWHHILFDGWSMPILMEEFLTTYEALVSGNEIIPVETDRFEDYIRYLDKGDKAREENYWRNYLSGLEQSSLLPFITATNERTKGAGIYKTLSVQLDNTAASAVHRYAQSNRLTINTLMQGVWCCLLRQYTGNDKVVFGVIVSGRPDDLPNVEKRVGLYINAVPLYTEANNEKEITAWLQNLQAEQVASRQYQYSSLNDIQGWCGMQGDLFDSLLVFDNYPVSKIIAAGQWSLQVEHAHLHEQNNYPLSIEIISNPEQINIQFIYNTSLIEDAYANNLPVHFEQVLMQLVSNKIEHIGGINLLTQAEKDQQLNQFNDASVSLPKNKTVIDLFEEQVFKAPDALAIIFKEDKITYHQLNEHANRLACLLIKKGVQKEMPVPVCLQKSVEMMVAVLGILKAGAVYVPIDPNYPADRIKYMLEDTGATIVLSNEADDAALQGIIGIEIIELDEALLVTNSEPAVNIQAPIATNNLAYIIYTSGSTGRPKGVMVEHGSLVHYLTNNKINYLDNGVAGAGSFIHLSYTFDASLTAMLMPLLCGKLVVIGSKQSVEIFEDPNLWEYAPYDFIKITPSHLALLEPVIKNLNGAFLTTKLVIGGEALNPGHFNYLIEKNINLHIINEYGPTEATVGCSTYCFNTIADNEKIKNNIPIGKPLSNTQLFIVNADTNLLPIGVAGEICISGDGLARGYLNQPDLTAEKFSKNPFSKKEGAVMYKTGDLGRWLPDGNMEYLGRKDEQVKINGYRIELGEIESVLSSMKGVSNTKLIVKEGSAAGSKKLTAYLQIDKEKLPLLSNYVGLLNKKQVHSSVLQVLPNGLPMLTPYLHEINYLYSRIFEAHCYLKQGVVLNDDSCVVDVGANVGFFSVYLTALHNKIKVYSVEPIPEVYNYLVANRELYNINGKAFQLALSDAAGEVEVTFYPRLSIASAMNDEKNDPDEAVRAYIEKATIENWGQEEIGTLLNAAVETRQLRCATKTLSSIIEEEKIEKIDLLKITVENSAHLVINGIEDKDWDKIKNVLIEVKDIDGRRLLITEILERNGFTTEVEKKEMLPKDNTVYYLSASKTKQKKAPATLANNETIRSVQWKHPVAFVKNIEKDISEKLPAYMLPSTIILLNQFPLTRNGKIDKNALPDVAENGVVTGLFVAPRNELEEKLAHIWKEILEVETVGVQDDFFKLGGDSLLSIRLVSSIRRTLEVELAISTFFELATIEKVANYIKINRNDFPVQFDNYEEIKL